MTQHPAADYLQRLRKALRDAAPEEQEEILSDIRSLIDEHLEASASLDEVLQRLGPPEALAEAYRTEGLLSRAAHSSAPLLMLKAALRFAASGLLGFATALVVFIGYTLSLGFFAVTVLKFIFPEQTGMWIGGGEFTFGMVDTHHPGAHEVLGYWAVPVGILLGLLSFVLSTWLARRFMRFHLQRFPLKSR